MQKRNKVDYLGLIFLSNCTLQKDKYVEYVYVISDNSLFRAVY